MDHEPPKDESAPPDDLGLEGFAQPSDEDGLSLEELSEAYAQLVDGGDDPYHDSSSPEMPSAEESEAEADGADDEGDVSPRGILEAMLFVGNPEGEPLTSKYVASLMRGVSPREIDELVGELNAAYEESACPYQIESSGAGYLLKLRDEFAGLRDKFYGRVRDAKLSQAAVDVLALVAYRQPLTTDEVTKLRGTPSGAVLSQLVRRQLLRIERPDEKPRKPRYYTTDRFLHVFGLAAIGELPHSQDIDATL
jgi:segregation and condensation protein B